MSAQCTARVSRKRKRMFSTVVTSQINAKHRTNKQIIELVTITLHYQRRSDMYARIITSAVYRTGNYHVTSMH